MKRLLTAVLVTAMLVWSATLLAGQEGAKNKVDIVGSLAKDSQLIINLDWTVDTANYKPDQKQNVRQLVREEMWKAMLPKLVDKTAGTPVSFSSEHFVKQSENVTLLQQRPNGTDIYSVKVQVVFKPNILSITNAPKQPKQELEDKMTDEYRNRFVHDL